MEGFPEATGSAKLAKVGYLDYLSSSSVNRSTPEARLEVQEGCLSEGEVGTPLVVVGGLPVSPQKSPGKRNRRKNAKRNEDAPEKEAETSSAANFKVSGGYKVIGAPPDFDNF